MKHPTPEELSAFHDGIADAKTLVAVEMHLNECAECHEVLASFERQDRALTRALTHDPGDEHFELLAGRIERKLGTKPRGEGAPGVAGVLSGTLEASGARVRGWLEGLMRAMGKAHPPEWAGALAALLVGLGLVLLNVKHSPGPALRDYALERRAGQAAPAPGEADEARGGAPGAGAPLAARDDARRATPPAAARTQKSAVRSVQPPSIVAAPPAGAASKQEAPAGRAQLVKRMPSGEEQPVRTKAEGFARTPPPAPGEQGGAKPRRALPLEESQPKVEGATRASRDAKEADRARHRDEPAPTAGEKSAAPSPTAVLPPEPEAPRPDAAVGTAARESGTRPSPASFAEPQSSKPDVRVAPAIRTCGVVRDSRGRPISSATVTLVSQGTGVSSDAEGRFCIEAPPGDQTVSVIAVGFSPLQFDVHVAPESPPLVLTLLAVSVIEGSQALRGNVQTLGGKQQTGAPGELLPGFPDSLQPVAGRAIRLTLEAERTKSAPRFEAAAVEWERVRDRAEPGSLQLEARFRSAEARFRAWQLAPSPKRVAAANEALTSYLVRATLGARRDTASAWLGRVKP